MKSIQPFQTLFLGVTLLITALAGCATKKEPHQVYVKPIRSSQVAPIAKEIERSTPGEIMDPHSEVFAQVPERIIYLPGEEGLTSRQSPEQLAAYRLVKVGELPEVRDNQPSTVILTDPYTSQERGARDVMNITIQEDGKSEEGTARSLKVTSSEKIDLARSRIRKGETLKFIEGTGWVGWIPKDGSGSGTTIQPNPNRVPPPLTIPSLEELPVDPEVNPTPTATPTPKPEPTPDSTPKPSNVPPPLQPDRTSSTLPEIDLSPRSKK